MKNTRSDRYRMMISTDDKIVKLIHKETNEEYYPMYKNVYGRIYFWQDDEPIFIREDCIDKYEIVGGKNAVN